MIDDRDLFERAAQRFAPPERSFDRLVRRRDRKRRNQRIAAGAVGIVIAMAVALTGVILLRSEPVPADRTPTGAARNGEIVMVRGFFWRSDTNPELVAVDPGTGDIRQLATCDQECFVSPGAWSPDGTELLYSSGGILHGLDFETGSSRVIVASRSGNGIFSPDGERIVYDAGRPPRTPTEFHLVGRDGGIGTTLRPLGGMNLWWYQWLPDGRSIAYFEHGVHLSDGSIAILDLDGRPTARTLVSFPEADPCNGPSSPLGCVHSTAMSPVDGRIAYAMHDPEAGTDTVRLIDPDDGAITRVGAWTVTGRPGTVPSRLAWSPDGSRIAYAADCQIWSIAPDGTDRVLLKDLGACTTTPDRLTWSPDGAELAFFELARDAAGTLEDATLTVLTLDGGAIRRLATFPSDDAVGIGPFVWRPVP